jgi:cytosine/creatinine deaminase
LSLLLRRARLVDGRVVDIRLADERIAAVGDLELQAGEDTIDLDGYLVLPAPAEPHAHLDKALTADRVHNATGDLGGAVAAWLAFRTSLSVDDIAERAERAARIGLGYGITAIRTHVDVAADFGIRSVVALERVRKNLDGLLDLQVVALTSCPLTGVAGAGNRAALRDAMDAGADVVGGCPHLDPDPTAAMHFALDVAGELDRPIDLHTDETLDVSILNLAEFAEAVHSSGFRAGASASHCVSLGMQDIDTQERVAALAAEAGVSVITLPQTNLFLQGRDHRVGVPRGLTALRPLLAAGANLAAGGDNLQDPFNTMGRGDPMETAALLVMAGHLRPDEAYATVSAGARRAMGLPLVTVAPGDPAELLAIRGGGLRDAVADASVARIVFHRGRQVARTTITFTP